MICYYNTEAEYAAAQKSAFESQISLVGADNNIHFDGVNVVVGLQSARTGDACVLDGNGAMHFIARGTFSSTSFFSNYIYVGPVLVGTDHEDFRGTVVIGHKYNAAKQISYIYSFKLTGYTLDSTDRTGTLRVYSDANNYADYVISYNASNVSDFVDQLNAYFQDTSHTVFQTQDWVASADGDGVVSLQFCFTFGKQASDAGSSGFTLTANLLPDIEASTAMMRYNGQRTGEGCIWNWDRTIAYFSADLNNATYNPTTTQTAAQAKRSYPICKPGYLGTSQYSGGEDRCAAIRAIYGEGEDGWLRFMKTFYPVNPTKYGVVGDLVRYGDGHTNTYKMAGKTFVGQNGVSHQMFPAADYCAAITFPHALLGSGKWDIPDAATLSSIFKTIKYNTTNNRNADPINATQYAAGGDAISNGANAWSSSRCSASSFWCGYINGFFINFNVYFAFRVLPVVLLKVNEVNR